MQSEQQQEKSALFVTALTSFMAPFMISSVNVALPAIQSEFGVDAVTLGWIPTSYLLAMAILLVPAGKFADIYGRKKIFLSGVVLYTLASTVAAFVPDVGWLLAMRAGQGMGAALFVTTAMAILTSVVVPQRRGRALGILVSAVYVGLASGPFVGGLMTRYLGWRALFGIMFFLGIGILFVALRNLEGEWAEAKGERFDLVGSLLYGSSVFCLVYGAIRMPALFAGLLLLSGIGLMVIFFLHQSKVESPVFEVRLFRHNRIFLFSSLAALINYAATFAVTFQLSLYLQYVKGMAPHIAGMVLMAQPLIMALFSPWAGKLSDRKEPRVLASMGMAITAAGLAVLATLSLATPVWLIVIVLLVLGFGFALFSSPNMSAIMGSVERRYFGIASGTVATMRLLGQMISMSVATIFLVIFVGRKEIGPDTLPSFLQSMHVCLLLFVLFCVVGIYFSFFRGKKKEEV
ncbi:MAG: MFS transporter [Proteobacteria bacterium]|nr:MFS transporter [Pseudomonadota bacterium]MBU1057251.1 MFS transporter [Pseudomonadota bacterium]